MIISCFILLRMRKFSNKFCREYRNKHFVFNNIFSEDLTFYEMWEYRVKPDRQQTKTRSMRFESWKIKATDTHSDYVIYAYCLYCCIFASCKKVTIMEIKSNTKLL